MYKRSSRRLLAAAVTSIACTPLHAAETVEPVVVTATRTAQTADESLASVTVLTRQDIEESQAESLTTLLGRVQGVEHTRSGSRGATSSLFLRGTESDHVVVLVDGIRVGSATTGTTAFEQLPLENIERIEIVRGPRSSLYGADAIGGVIQIFTRAGTGARASAGAGSHDLRKASAGYGAGDERGRFSVELSFEDTEGFDNRENDCGTCTDAPDDDGYTSRSASVNGQLRLSDTVTLSGQALVADGENEFDAFNENREEFIQRTAGGKLAWQLSPRWDTSFHLGHNTDESVNFLDAEETSHFRTDRTDIAWQNDVVVGDAGLLTMGVDARHEEVDSNADFDETERDTAGAFVQHQWTGTRWNTQASLRHETYDEFDDQDTGSLAAGYRIVEGLRAFSSYGTAFKAPTFNELYFPDNMFFRSNPELDPERSKSLEMGLRGQMDLGNWEISAYRTDIDDLIETVEEGGVFEPQNIDEARIEGIETTLETRGAGWSANISAGYKNPRDVETGNQLPQRAKETFDAGVSRSLGRWTLGADASYRGERFDDAANDTRLEPYTVVDLRASWRFARDWSARFKVGNATDEDYQLVDTFNTDGRNYLVQVDWRPGASD